MIVAIGDVSGSQRRVRRQLGMSEAISPDALSPIPTRRGELLAARAPSAAASPPPSYVMVWQGTLLLQPPAQLIDGAGMVPARIVKQAYAWR